MDWYRRSSKTYRDQGRGFITLWHISPDRISVFQGRSSFIGMSGLFFSQSYKSLIADWAQYVSGRKQKNNQLVKQIVDLNHEIYDLEDKKHDEGLTEEEENRLFEMMEKQRRLMKTRSSPGCRRNESDIYRTLYIYKVSCPIGVYRKSMDLMMGELKRQEDAGTVLDNFGFWGWGEQVFIPSEFFRHLKIVGTEKVSIDDVQQREVGLRRDRYRDVGRISLEDSVFENEGKKPGKNSC